MNQDECGENLKQKENDKELCHALLKMQNMTFIHFARGILHE